MFLTFECSLHFILLQKSERMSAAAFSRNAAGAGKRESDNPLPVHSSLPLVGVEGFTPGILPSAPPGPPALRCGVQIRSRRICEPSWRSIPRQSGLSISLQFG
jgi:hypothetical protein